MKHWPTRALVAGYWLTALSAILLAWGVSVYYGFSFFYSLLLVFGGPLIAFGVILLFIDSETASTGGIILTIAFGIWFANGHFAFSKTVSNYIFFGLAIGGCLLSLGTWILHSEHDERNKADKAQKEREAVKQAEADRRAEKIQAKADRLARLTFLYGSDVRQIVRKDLKAAIQSFETTVETLWHADGLHRLEIAFRGLQSAASDFVITEEFFACDRDLVLLADAFCTRLDEIIPRIKYRSIGNGQEIRSFIEMERALSLRLDLVSPETGPTEPTASI